MCLLRTLYPPFHLISVAGSEAGLVLDLYQDRCKLHTEFYVNFGENVETFLQINTIPVQFGGVSWTCLFLFALYFVFNLPQW